MGAQRTAGQPEGRVTGATFAGLLILLAAPAAALCRLSSNVDWRMLMGMPLVVSFFTWLAYRSDKRRAQAGESRIPEMTLHLGELLGGWPGAFLAQRQFRHKTAKISFQIIFWLIVVLHEWVALDFLTDWKLTSRLIQLFKT